VDILVDCLWNVTGSAGIIDTTDQTRTFVHPRITRIAIVDDLLKSFNVPSADEVGV
jgi:hypothetical protein